MNSSPLLKRSKQMVLRMAIMMVTSMLRIRSLCLCISRKKFSISTKKNLISGSKIKNCKLPLNGAPVIFVLNVLSLRKNASGPFGLVMTAKILWKRIFLP